MLATGIKSPVGVKVAGTDLATIDRIAGEIERVVKDVPGVTSARWPSGSTGGRYIDVKIDRDAAARYGLNIADVQRVIATGRRRREHRRDRRRPAALSDQRALSARECAIRWRSCASCRCHRARRAASCWTTSPNLAIVDGPPMLRSENARLSGWVYVDIRGRDLRSAVHEMQRAVAEKVELPAGYSISWSGQFEYLERATREAEGRRARHAR